MSKISVYIIAFNEAEKIRAAIESVLWADEILLIDSHSTDGTSEIAEALGAKVYHVEFKGYGELRNTALDLCQHDWIFSLDADERCTPEVRNEIQSIVARSVSKDLYFVPRRNYFMGRWIRHSGWYPNYRQPQLFRNGKMRYDSMPVHEGFISISDQIPGVLGNSIWQIPFKDVGEVLRKADKYSTLGAKKISMKRIRPIDVLVHATWAFLKHYIFKRGFLDGWPGFVIALGNFDGTFYRYLKAMESERRADWAEPRQEPIQRNL
jgi:glycosyltransferase involved in cell wall biosynthesis